MNSGDGLLVGSNFGVATGAALSGATIEAALVGVFDLTKVGSQAWSPGDRVYWDNTAKQTTKTAFRQHTDRHGHRCGRQRCR